MRWIIFGILSVALACQTTPKSAVVVVLPAYLHSHFDQCISDSGTLEIEGAQKGQFTFNGEVDWRIDARKNFAFEVVNTVGQGLWKVDREGNLLDVSGLYAEDMPKITIDKETQKIMTGGYFAGFMVSEIPCLFKFKIPSAWQDKIIKSEIKGKGSEFLVSDPYRTIKISIDQSNGADHSKVCTDIEWSHFMGLSKQNLKWCYQKLRSKKARYGASLEFEDKIKLKWKTASDG